MRTRGGWTFLGSSLTLSEQVRSHHIARRTRFIVFAYTAALARYAQTELLELKELLEEMDATKRSNDDHAEERVCASTPRAAHRNNKAHKLLEKVDANLVKVAQALPRDDASRSCSTLGGAAANQGMHSRHSSSMNQQQLLRSMLSLADDE